MAVLHSLWSKGTQGRKPHFVTAWLFSELLFLIQVGDSGNNTKQFPQIHSDICAMRLGLKRPAAGPSPPWCRGRAGPPPGLHDSVGSPALSSLPASLPREGPSSHLLSTAGTLGLLYAVGGDPLPAEKHPCSGAPDAASWPEEPGRLPREAASAPGLPAPRCRGASLWWAQGTGLGPSCTALRLEEALAEGHPLLWQCLQDGSYPVLSLEPVLSQNIPELVGA